MLGRDQAGGAFVNPIGVALGGEGSLYVLDQSVSTQVWKVDAMGVISLLASVKRR